MPPGHAGQAIGDPLLKKDTHRAPAAGMPSGHVGRAAKFSTLNKILITLHLPLLTGGR